MLFRSLTYDEMRSVVEAVETRSLPDLHVSAVAGGMPGRAQARPGSVVEAIAPHVNGLKIAPFTWGFPIQGGKKLVFNTRLESALSGTGMWAPAIRGSRCLLPVASFFEPHMAETATSSRTGKPIKRQYEFAATGGAPLLLAAVSSSDRLSVVTTEPNAAVAPIHPRMPLVLRFEEVPVWLEGDYASLADRTGLAFEIAPETAAAAPLASSNARAATPRVPDDAQPSLF